MLGRFPDVGIRARAVVPQSQMVCELCACPFLRIDYSQYFFGVSGIFFEIHRTVTGTVKSGPGGTLLVSDGGGTLELVRSDNGTDDDGGGDVPVAVTVHGLRASAGSGVTLSGSAGVNFTGTLLINGTAQPPAFAAAGSGGVTARAPGFRFGRAMPRGTSSSLACGASLGWVRVQLNRDMSRVSSTRPGGAASSQVQLEPSDGTFLLRTGYSYRIRADLGVAGIAATVYQARIVPTLDASRAAGLVGATRNAGEVLVVGLIDVPHASTDGGEHATFALELYCSGLIDADALGIFADLGEDELFAQVEVWPVAELPAAASTSQPAAAGGAPPAPIPPMGLYARIDAVASAAQTLPQLTWTAVPLNHLRTGSDDVFAVRTTTHDVVIHTRATHDPVAAAAGRTARSAWYANAFVPIIDTGSALLRLVEVGSGRVLLHGLACAADTTVPGQCVLSGVFELPVSAAAGSNPGVRLEILAAKASGSLARPLLVDSAALVFATLELEFLDSAARPYPRHLAAQSLTLSLFQPALVPAGSWPAVDTWAPFSVMNTVDYSPGTVMGGAVFFFFCLSRSWPRDRHVFFFFFFFFLSLLVNSNFMQFFFSRFPLPRLISPRLGSRSRVVTTAPSSRCGPPTTRTSRRCRSGSGPSPATSCSPSRPTHLPTLSP
jgi:hypothetical protein